MIHILQQSFSHASSAPSPSILYIHLLQPNIPRVLRREPSESLPFPPGGEAVQPGRAQVLIIAIQAGARDLVQEMGVGFPTRNEDFRYRVTSPRKPPVTAKALPVVATEAEGKRT